MYLLKKLETANFFHFVMKHVAGLEIHNNIYFTVLLQCNASVVKTLNVMLPPVSITEICIHRNKNIDNYAF